MDWPPYGYTMVGNRRMQNVKFAIEDVVSKNIKGDFAELGVWRGGASIYARLLLNVFGQASRKVHVFDAFESIPGYGASADFLQNSMASVQKNFEKFGALDKNVQFYKGLFKNTVPPFRGTLAVLRIDGNFYDSYQDALYYMYPQVPVGGLVIWDDVMSHPDVMQCWKDFKKDYNMTENLIQIDIHSAWFRKVRHFNVDFKKMRAPRDANLEK